MTTTLKQTALTEGKMKISLLREKEEAIDYLIEELHDLNSQELLISNRLQYLRNKLEMVDLKEQLLAVQQTLAEWEFRIWNYEEYTAMQSAEANANFDKVLAAFEQIKAKDGKYIFWANYAKTQDVMKFQAAKNQIYNLMKGALEKEKE